MGVLLDPLADKLLIAAAFITLVQFNPSMVPAWIAVIIIGREFLVSGLRSIAASEGFAIEASDLGKFKMLVQIVSVVAVILDHRWKECRRLLHRFLVKDRPAGGEEAPPRVCPQPSEEARCRRNLNTRPILH